MDARTKSGTVLIVEDDPSTSIALRLAIEKRGYSALEACSGEEALAAVSDPAIALVVLDLGLPGMGGLAVLEVVRRTRTSIDLPVIIVTADDDPQSIRAAFSAGANDYLKKPLDLVVALIRIEMQLSLRRTTADLARAKEASDAASLAKSAFLVTMSHEFRTPMNTIMGMAEALGATALTARQEAVLRMLKRSGASLVSLIDQVLDFSRIESGEESLDRVDFDLVDTLDTVTESLSVAARRKGLDLVCHSDPGLPPVVRGDSLKLRQILQHLVSNAIKFSDAGEIVIRAVPVREPPGAVAVRFSVKDQGIGIEHADQSRIFERFTQLDGSLTRRYGGTGLGLSIAQKLVRLMGGDIQVVSFPGRGSAFSFELVLEVPPEPGDEVRVERPPDLDGKRVLVVDGGETSSREIADHLVAWRADVRMVTSAREGALALAEARSFDIVLLEVPASRDDFAEATRALVSAAGPTVPVWLMLRPDEEGVLALAESLDLPWLTRPIQIRALGRVLADPAPSKGARSGAADAAALLPDRRIDLLLVDDSMENRLVVQTHLRGTRVEFDMAENGVVALEKFRSRIYDLVLMDIQMPEMDGLEATRHMRAHERELSRAPTPILALTAHALPKEKDRALEAGCDEYLIKPISRPALIKAMATRLAAPPAPPVPEIDPRYVAEVDPDFRPLITEYLKHRAEDVTAIKVAVEGGDFPALRTLGHNMKGTGSAFGMHAISRIGGSIEKAALASDLTAVGTLLAELEDYLANVTIR